MKKSAELLVYKASAGSGKTFTLAVEYIKLLIENPRNYRQILAVTFTNKATAEMKERILSQLYGIAMHLSESDVYLDNISVKVSLPVNEIRKRAALALQLIIHDYGRFRVETIDSFFQSVVRNLAKELDLGGNLAIELDNNKVVSDAVDELMRTLQSNSQEMQWLVGFMREKIEVGSKFNITENIKKFASKYIFDEHYIAEGEILQQQLNESDKVKHFMDILKDLRESASLPMKKYAEQFQAILLERQLTEKDFSRGRSGAYGYFAKLDQGVFFDDKIVNSYVQKAMDTPEGWVTKTNGRREEIMALAEQQLIPLLHKAEKDRSRCTQVYHSCNLSLQNLNELRMFTTIDRYIRIQNNLYNRFLLPYANILLSKLSQDDPAFIFEKLGASIQHIMMDEFQDTSNLQWHCFRLLLLEGLSQGADSLIVGDVKQSIYRFRNANWNILNGLEGQFENAFPINVHTLDTNRRSEANIIHFNNAVFDALKEKLSQQYKQQYKTDECALDKAYADVIQKSPKKEEKGYVGLHFIPQETRDNAAYEEEMLALLVQQVEVALEKGVDLNDICILIRKNRYIPTIAQYFEENTHYHVVSDEAFRLERSSAVNVIITALRYLIQPDDKLMKAELALVFQKKVMNRALDTREILEHATNYLPEELVQRLETLRFMPLYELVEELMAIFSLLKYSYQAPYLLCFLDEVMDYTGQNTADIYSFLKYWDEKLSLKTIAAGKIEGIRIMSVHKSKGLEAHTVIVPYFDWNMEKESSQTQLVWCSPEIEPFNELDLLPIAYKREMTSSIYQRDYQQEQLQLWVENLNLIYVAFTRAKSNLIVLGKQGKLGKIAVTVSDYLAEAVEGLYRDKTLSFERIESPLSYHFGVFDPSQKIKTKTSSENRLQPISTPQEIQLQSYPASIAFRQSNRSEAFIKGEWQEGKQEQYIHEGQLLHALFAEIRHKSDVEQAIQAFCFEGLISQQRAKQLSDFVNHALEHPQAKQWFTEPGQLFNECAILTQEKGEVIARRPDRVMVKDGCVTVVDFKFGKEKAEHHEQVRMYLELLEAMNYTQVQGYLWYVYRNEVVNVQK